THHPKEALTWVESHYNDRVVVSVRSRGLGGPLATMIGPDLQGLAIFGSITKKYVLRAAHILADASGYPVIIQPRSDDPILVWGTPVTPGPNGEQSDPPTAPESGYGVGGGGDDDGDDEGIMRTPTGDEVVDKNRSWIGPIPPSNIHLKLCGASTVDYDVNIALETQLQFMVENRINSQNDATPWTVSHTYGGRSKFPDSVEHVEYYCWDIAHDTHAEKNPRDPLEVVFSVNITPAENRNPQNLMPSAGPFINRNQTMVWVANEKLRSKGFGMIIATSLYFPSCLIRTPISTTRAAVVDLRDMSLSPPAEEREGDPNARPGETFSLFSLIPPFSSVLYRIKNVDVNFHDSDKIEPRGWVMGQDN
ncbi:hypothetical protein C8R46DRAFT_1328224, partial [Mycena filopes]